MGNKWFLRLLFYQIITFFTGIFFSFHFRFLTGHKISFTKIMLKKKTVLVLDLATKKIENFHGHFYFMGRIFGNSNGQILIVTNTFSGIFKIIYNHFFYHRHFFCFSQWVRYFFTGKNTVGLSVEVKQNMNTRKSLWKSIVTGAYTFL